MKLQFGTRMYSFVFFDSCKKPKIVIESEITRLKFALETEFAS
jgi:hypothetical protein